mmetsp:Transcript_73228/g.169882  ORF Transcript_73228/g.169882 Transcript_73228/m.169882 type:complete len:201 (-) Transcript_73228:109-711(-)
MGSCYAAQKRTDAAVEEPSGLRQVVLDNAAGHHHQTTTSTLLRLLQYRELTPEDFELLSQLDERVPRKGALPQSLIDLLPQVRARECNTRDCAVCLSKLRPEAPVRRLPCSHAFCPKCIDSWLTEYKGECPICRLPVEGQLEPSTREPSVSADPFHSSDSEYESTEWVEGSLDAQVPRRHPQDVCVTRCDGIGKRLAYRL